MLLKPSFAEPAVKSRSSASAAGGEAKRCSETLKHKLLAGCLVTCVLCGELQLSVVRGVGGGCTGST